MMMMHSNVSLSSSLTMTTEASDSTHQAATTLAQLESIPSPLVMSSVPVDAVHLAAAPVMTAFPAGAEATSEVTNTKEKTPMCLINELARFNKIYHQYKLMDETGPAHQKEFTILLKLGDHEEYTAKGPSIKKAQHSAAALALENTKLKHPPVRPRRFNRDFQGPCAELSELAANRGEQVEYHQIDPPRFVPYMPNLDFRGMFNQRYHYPKMPRVFYVSLKVGSREFIGEGTTKQNARNSAAVKALKVLSTLPPPEAEKQTDVTQVQVDETNANNADITADDTKSPISLVYEIALRQNLSVNFEVTDESGPPHMRMFVTRCTVGQFSTEDKGNGKKLSKKSAAEKMLDELKKLPPSLVPQNVKPRIKPLTVKKKSKNLVKVEQAEKTNPDYGDGINPISRLIQIQQAKKAKEPVYSLIAENGQPRRREFVIQVQVDGLQCTGTGPNKKLAKRAAAEAMLQALGYSRPHVNPAKPALKSLGGNVDSNKKVTFVDQDGMHKESSSGRQLVPGLLLMPDPAQHMTYGHNANMNRAFGMGDMISNKYCPQTSSTIARELLDKGSSPTAETILENRQPVTHPVVRPKQQLIYLANVLGFQVEFTDFPKGNKSEYLSLVSISTTPPQVSHGSGLTLEASHDHAALTALRALADTGLDAVKQEKNLASGDGLHLQKQQQSIKVEPQVSPPAGQTVETGIN